MRRRPMANSTARAYPTLLEHPGSRALLVGAVMAAGAACGDGSDSADPLPPEGDTDTDTDTDADTDADTDTIDGDTYGFPPLVSFGLMYGMRDGEVVDVEVGGAPLAPTIHFTFAEEEYLDSWDDRYKCDTFYDLAVSPGTSEPDAWFDYVLGATFRETDCPDVEQWRIEHWGWDPETMEITLAPADASLLAKIGGHLGEEYEGKLYGGEAYLEGESLVADGQDLFGWAWEVDASMASTGELMDAKDFGAGGDALVEVSSAYFYHLY